MCRLARTLVVLISLVMFLSVSGFAATSGIWKSTDDSYSFYVQTYSGGECIVIATKDGTEFLVFLDPTVEDGIDANEYFDKPAGLKIDFKDAASAYATLVLEGDTFNYEIERRVEADCRSLWEGSSTDTSSGIWKSESPADSFYIQTYSAGSAILIETVDGINFNVFLDGDISDGVACQEYFGKPATLSATFQGAGQGVADLTKNGPTQYNISRLFVDDCRNVQPTPVYPPEISHAGVYTVNGFGSHWLGFAAEILDESGAVETAASAWVIGPGNQYTPLRYDPGAGIYSDNDAGLDIVKGDYTFHAEKSGVAAVPLKKTLSDDFLIQPPVISASVSPQVGQPWTVKWGAVTGAHGYFVFFNNRDVPTSLWKNVESVFDPLPNVTSITIPGNLITANTDYEFMLVASEDSNVEESSAASIARLEVTTK